MKGPINFTLSCLPDHR